MKDKGLIFLGLCCFLPIVIANQNFEVHSPELRAIFNYFPKKCAPGLIWKHGHCRRKLRPNFKMNFLLKLIKGFQRTKKMYAPVVYN